eukprot:sb/3470867/
MHHIYFTYPTPQRNPSYYILPTPPPPQVPSTSKSEDALYSECSLWGSPTARRRQTNALWHTLPLVPRSPIQISCGEFDREVPWLDRRGSSYDLLANTTTSSNACLFVCDCCVWRMTCPKTAPTKRTSLSLHRPTLNVSNRERRREREGWYRRHLRSVRFANRQGRGNFVTKREGAGEDLFRIIFVSNVSTRWGNR